MVQREMKQLRLDVPIREVQITGSKRFPMLRTTDWIRCIDQGFLWEKVLGTNDFEAGQKMLVHFWDRYEKLYPSSRLFEVGFPRNLTLPMYIHGDEGQHYKKGAVMVCQWQ